MITVDMLPPSVSVYDHLWYAPSLGLLSVFADHSCSMGLAVWASIVIALTEWSRAAIYTTDLVLYSQLHAEDEIKPQAPF